MKNSTRITGLILFFLTISCQKDEVSDSGPVVMSARDSVVMNYKNDYLGSAVTNIDWTGSTTNCSAGTISQNTKDLMLKRLNYFRKLVGLHEAVLDEKYHNDCQESALMMKANNKLDHYPTSTWKCYTKEGANTSNRANLALGLHSTNAISAFIDDYGASNIEVGHRRRLLYSKETSFSVGSTNSSCSILPRDVWPSAEIKKIPYVAYPARGYFPQQLAYDRWSFAIEKANFTDAQVTMKGASGDVALTVVYRKGSSNWIVGDNAIVWEPKSINKTSKDDVTYTVTISGIKNAPKTEYTYDVILIRP